MKNHLYRELCFLLSLGAVTQACNAEHTAPAPNRSPITIEDDTLQLNVASPYHFNVQPAEEASALALLPVTGRVTTVANLTSPSFAPLSGRIIQVAVRLGDRVKMGDRLIEVKAAELPTLQRDQQAARLTIQTKEAVVHRVEQLVSARIAPESDLVLARSELSEARLSASAASARIEALSVKQSGNSAYWIVAGRAGTVVQLSAAPGQHVVPDESQPISTIADLSEVIVEADVPQRDVSLIEEGESAKILLANGLESSVEGLVESISEVVDPSRQAVTVRVRVLNDKRLLRPNAFVSVIFSPSNQRKVIVIPSSSVVSDGARSAVFVEEKTGSFQRKFVELGRRTKEKVEITQGLSPLDRIVTSGALLLSNALDVGD